MAERIKLVQGDTRPSIVVQLSDSSTGSPIDLTETSVILMKFRKEGETALTATLTGELVPGTEIEDTDGEVTYDAPYDVNGVGGRVRFNWLDEPTALDGEPGNYEAEVEMTFLDGSVQTSYDTLKFKLREDF